MGWGWGVQELWGVPGDGVEMRDLQINGSVGEEQEPGRSGGHIARSLAAVCSASPGLPTVANNYLAVMAID